jgi:hypothetical protein
VNEGDGSVVTEEAVEESCGYLADAFEEERTAAGRQA